MNYAKTRDERCKCDRHALHAVFVGTAGMGFSRPLSICIYGTGVYSFTSAHLSRRAASASVAF